MNNTYSVTAENRCNPYITYHLEGLTEKQARFAIKNLWTAFRSIEVINEETGEVVFSHYEGSDFFQPSETEAEAIAKVNAIFSM